jgi:hypothetical protein
MNTAEKVYKEILNMPVKKREKLLAVIARKGFEKESYRHREVFDEIRQPSFTVKEAAEYPESFRATWTRSGDGRGLAISGPSHIPRTHIPVKLARAHKAARHPASHHETPTVTASRARLQGNLAVEEMNWRQPADEGVAHWTNCVTATSPGKYGKNLAPTVWSSVPASSPVQAYCFTTTVFPFLSARRGVRRG